MKNSLRTVLFGAFLILSPALWAHVTVSPHQVAPASWVTFSVSVPNEKDEANTQLKLLLPEGLEYVTPTAKPGWTITIERTAEGKAAALVWAGSLAAEFRDDFTFSAHVTASSELVWKAYQTYTSGTVVGWEVDPTSAEAKDPEALEKTGKGPASVTKVVEPEAAPVAAQGDSVTTTLALILAVAALAVAVVALIRSKEKPAPSKKK